MSKIIEVGIADLNICKSPNSLTTVGLGSCVGLLLYDPINKIAGLSHIMLPYYEEFNNKGMLTAFANTSIEILIYKMLEAGANKGFIVAKVVGGSKMFNSKNINYFNIGERNIKSIKENLKKYNINIIAEDIGGNYSRTIEFSPQTGKLIVKSVGRKEIIL